MNKETNVRRIKTSNVCIHVILKCVRVTILPSESNTYYMFLVMFVALLIQHAKHMSCTIL